MSLNKLSSRSQQMYAQQTEASNQVKLAGTTEVPIPITPSQEAAIQLEKSLNGLSEFVNDLEKRASAFLRPEPICDAEAGNYIGSEPVSQITIILKEATERVRCISCRINSIIDRLE